MLPLVQLMMFVCMALLAMSPARAETTLRPEWEEPQDSYLAENKPDEYAWRLFVALNWPADEATKLADPRKPFGVEGPVVWEVWKNANDVYLQEGADPGNWTSTGARDDTVTATRFSALTPLQQINAKHVVNGVMVPIADFTSSTQQLREMHMNRITFEYIRANELYNIDGQILRYRQQTPVNFPLGAKEVKAEWMPIDDNLRSKYHTITLRMVNGNTQVYGLTALHILSKDLPNWFWATFEHVDNPSRSAAEPWLLDSVDKFACVERQSNCNRAPQGLGLQNTVWQYYRLRGSQTRFVNSNGQPTLLANSQLESGTLQHTSCMTCHARASIGLLNGRITRLEPFNSTESSLIIPGIKQAYIGMPRPEWYYTDIGSDVKQQVFMPLDFVWSLSKAQPKAIPNSHPLE